MALSKAEIGLIVSGALLAVVLIVFAVYMYEPKCRKAMMGCMAMMSGSKAAVETVPVDDEIQVLSPSGFAMESLDADTASTDPLTPAQASALGALSMGLDTIEEEMHRASATAVQMKPLDDSLIPMSSTGGMAMSPPPSQAGYAAGRGIPPVMDRPLRKGITSATMQLTTGGLPPPTRSHCSMLASGQVLTQIDPQEVDRCCQAYPDIAGCQ
jgi:hypothetical protein